MKKEAAAALDAIVRVTSIQFVLSHLYPLINSLKNPRALCDVFLWIKDALTKYELNDLALPRLIESLKIGFGNSNQTVRGAAVAAFGILNSLTKKGTV